MTHQRIARPITKLNVNPDQFDEFTRVNREAYMRDRFNDIKAGMLLTAQNTRSKIEEKDFLTIFLGLFGGIESSDNAARYLSWLDVAGSPYHEVDIIKNGKVVATVPGMIPNDFFNPYTDSEQTIPEQFARLKGIDNINPMAGVRAREEILDSKVRRNTNQQAMVDARRKWDTLLDKYKNELEQLRRRVEAERQFALIKSDVKGDVGKTEITPPALGPGMAEGMEMEPF